MTEFKLADVAKRLNIPSDEILSKFEAVDINETVTADQLRKAGYDPKKIVGFRQKLLQERLNRKGQAGIEIRIGAPAKEEYVKPIISKNPQDIQMRKSALNKNIQQVDVMRQTSRKVKAERVEGTESAEKIFSNEAEIESAIAVEKASKEIPADTAIEEVGVAKNITKSDDTEKPVKEETPIPSVKAAETVKEPPVRGWQAARPTEQRPRGDFRKPDNRPQDNRKQQSRPLNQPRTGYVPRDFAANRSDGGGGQRTDFRTDTRVDLRSDTRSDGKTYTRNAPRFDRPQTGARPTAGNYRPSTQQTHTSRPPQRGQPSRPYDNRPRAGGLRPATGFTSPETVIPKRDIKKPRTDSSSTKEDSKKPKIKTDSLSLKDLNKTIHEGISELDIEAEIEVAAEVAEESEAAAAAAVKPSKTEKKNKKKQAEKEYPAPFQHPTSIVIGENVTVAEMAGLLGIKAGELVKKLFSLGVLATVNQSIDADTAALLAIDYGVEVTKKVITEEDLFPVFEDNPGDMQRRPPVVTVMGHVDHGKTSLLDAIRSTSVAEKEAGGITQHIGAYEVNLDGRKITFLDTPGHEAFTSLRARGAQVTDIVILVVAANDGVMPQTKEAIDHASAAGVCVIVAINKIDRPDANSEKVKRQLAEYGILSEEWGGKHQFQEISAKKRTGIKELLELVLLEADMLELKGNPNRPAEAIVIESQLDKQRGPVATILVKKGTLRKGDTFVVGREIGRVRSMYNHLRAVQKEAGISAPVEVMGFSEVPEPGDTLVVTDEKTAKAIADLRSSSAKSVRETTSPIVSLTDLMDKIKEGRIKELNIIIKADVQGSLEALKSSLKKLSNQEVKVNVVHDATGGITESDVVLALASKAIIIGFNVRPDNNAKLRAEREKISIELYSVIYKAIEDVKLALEGLLTPETVEQAVGKVEVRQVFSVPKIGRIAGAYVLEGRVARTSNVRIIRDNVVVFDGKIGSLKRFAEDVKEVSGGYECGLSVERYQDIKEKDILEVYELVQEKRTLSDVAK
ncbi:MAG: translation initiation factor IF-2 [Deferribacteraceae bacterium]|jgi:translation initiation factor IF-2|nr:translation initiation factor IF-2 [Deferribacteraceae bacterium]